MIRRPRTVAVHLVLSPLATLTLWGWPRPLPRFGEGTNIKRGFGRRLETTVNDFKETRLARMLQDYGEHELYAMMDCIDDVDTRVKCLISSLESRIRAANIDDIALERRLDCTLSAVYDKAVDIMTADDRLDDVYVAAALFCNRMGILIEPMEQKKELKASWEFLAKAMTDCWARINDIAKANALLVKLMLLPKSDQQVRFLADCMRQAMPKRRLERMSLAYGQVSLMAETKDQDWLARATQGLEISMAHAMVASMPREALRRQAKLNVALRDIHEASFQRMEREAELGLVLTKVAEEAKKMTIALITELELPPCDVKAEVRFKGNRPIIAICAYQEDNDALFNRDDIKLWAGKVLRSIPKRYGVCIAFACSGNGGIITSRK